MPQVRQIRKSQQQEFIHGLMSEVWEEAEKAESYHNFMALFAVAILTNWRGTFIPYPPEFTRYNEIYSFFRATREKIVQFARVEEEKKYLLWLLFEEITESVEQEMTSPYRNEEMKNPQAVYGAPSATDEVELS